MIEIIPKPIAKLPFWQNILFYLSIALLIISIISFFVLNRFLETAKAELQNLEETLDRERTPEEAALEKRVFDYQKKMEDFTTLKDLHLYPSKFFDFFQDLCHPQVWFSKFNLNLRNYDLTISGQTDTFSTLGQQLLIFQEREEIQEVNLSQLKISKIGKVDFTLSLSFDPAILK